MLRVPVEPEVSRSRGFRPARSRTPPGRRRRSQAFRCWRAALQRMPLPAIQRACALQEQRKPPPFRASVPRIPRSQSSCTLPDDNWTPVRSPAPAGIPHPFPGRAPRPEWRPHALLRSGLRKLAVLMSRAASAGSPLMTRTISALETSSRCPSCMILRATPVGEGKRPDARRTSNLLLPGVREEYCPLISATIGRQDVRSQEATGTLLSYRYGGRAS
jgi:hypothetical protein